MVPLRTTAAGVGLPSRKVREAEAKHSSRIPPSAARAIALWVPPGLVLLFGFLVTVGIFRAHSAEQNVQRTYTSLVQLHSLHSRLVEAEAAVRGFALTGDESFLEPLGGARAGADAAIGRLEALITDTVQLRRLALLRPIVHERLEAAETLVALRRAGPLPASLAAATLASGNTVMDSIRTVTASLQQRRIQLLEERSSREERSRRALLGLVGAGTAASVVVSLILNRLLGRYSARVETALLEAREYNLMLEEQAAELEMQAAELEETSEDLRTRDSYLRTVIDATPDVIIAQDADGRIQMANRAAEEVLGAPAGSIVGRLHRELNPHTEDVLALEQQVTRVITTGASHVTEREVADPLTGQSRWFETRVVPLHLSDHSVPQALVVGTDISPWREAEMAVRESQQEVLLRLAQAAEFRDEDTGRHTHRVGELASAIARALNDTSENAELIRRAAPLHDVGKIAIPDAILLKPGKLTPEEFEVMKTHTTIGASLLRGGGSPVMRLAEEIALCHHERWDGTGYPRGLAGEEIPLAARIVAIADFYDALTSDRPYRPAWPHAKVIAEIIRSAGTHFDPRVTAGLIAAVFGPSHSA